MPSASCRADTARKVASMLPDRTAPIAVSASKSVTTSSSVWGCAWWKPRSRAAGAIRLLITSTRSARRPGRTEETARSSACRSSRACGRNACPSTVSSAPRAVRVNSRTPRSFSSAAIRLETACWVIESSAAASENCPASLTATKVRTASRSTPTDPSPTTRRCGSPARRLFARQAPASLCSWVWAGSSGGSGRRMRSARSARGSRSMRSRCSPSWSCTPGRARCRCWRPPGWPWERWSRCRYLDRDRARAAARRGRVRPVRPGDDRAGQRGQLPAVGGRDPRHWRERAASGPGRRRAAAHPRPARRVAVHPGPRRAAPAVLQHDRGRRPDPGPGAIARGAHAGPSALRALAVRPGLRRPLPGRPARRGRSPPMPPSRP